MRDCLVAAGLIVAIFFSIIIQEFIPPVGFLHNARVYLVPVFFCYGALVLPFGLMILLAVVTGFLVDVSTLQVISGTVEIALGWSILVYVAIGAICQGLRPLVMRGHWELHALMSGVTIAWVLLIQFAVITLRRFDSGGIVINELVAWRILGPALIAVILSPAVFFLINAWAGYDRLARRRLEVY